MILIKHTQICLLSLTIRLYSASSNMSKFTANLSFLFKEKPFLERYTAAQQAGFKAVESGFPYGFTKEEVVNAKNSSGVQQVLVNILTGDVTKGELGHAAIPGEESQFRANLHTTIEYAKGLGARKIHIMAGKVQGEVTPEHDKVYLENLKYASKVLEQENIVGVIEPINPYSIPKYYMNNYEKAIQVIQAVNSPNLKLLLDVFHLQLIKGDITHTIEGLKPYIGHVQVAQAPNRGEPDSQGEINYKYVFDVLKQIGYEDWIGLEYSPVGDTLTGLKWIKNFGF